MIDLNLYREDFRDSVQTTELLSFKPELPLSFPLELLVQKNYAIKGLDSARIHLDGQAFVSPILLLCDRTSGKDAVCFRGETTIPLQIEYKIYNYNPKTDIVTF